MKGLLYAASHTRQKQEIQLMEPTGACRSRSKATNELSNERVYATAALTYQHDCFCTSSSSRSWLAHLLA